MSLLTRGLSLLENRLPKVIDARTHGIIDYGHATFFLSMALLCRKRTPPAAAAALVTGLFVLAESLLTDYPLGAKPVLSFETHGRLDGGFAGSSLAVPKLFGFEGTAAAKIFQANALVEATVVGLTDFNSQRAETQTAA